MNSSAPGQHEHARLIRRSNTGTEDVRREGSLSAMADAMFALPEDERVFHVVETGEGRFEEEDLIAKLQSGELDG